MTAGRHQHEQHQSRQEPPDEDDEDENEPPYAVKTLYVAVAARLL